MMLGPGRTFRHGKLRKFFPTSLVLFFSAFASFNLHCKRKSTQINFAAAVVILQLVASTADEKERRKERKKERRASRMMEGTFSSLGRAKNNNDDDGLKPNLKRRAANGQRVFGSSRRRLRRLNAAVECGRAHLLLLSAHFARVNAYKTTTTSFKASGILPSFLPTCISN